MNVKKKCEEIKDEHPKLSLLLVWWLMPLICCMMLIWFAFFSGFGDPPEFVYNQF